MSNIKSFDKTTLRALRPLIEKALADLGTEYGISLKLGNASFTPTNTTFKLELAIVGADGAVATKEANDLARYGKMFGLPADALNKTFKERGTGYTVTGLRTKASKYPVLVQRADGKVFCFPAERVASALALAGN